MNTGDPPSQDISYSPYANRINLTNKQLWERIRVLLGGKIRTTLPDHQLSPSFCGPYQEQLSTLAKSA